MSERAEETSQASFQKQKVSKGGAGRDRWDVRTDRSNGFLELLASVTIGSRNFENEDRWIHSDG